MDQKALIFASNIVHFGVILEHIRELFLQYVLFLFDMIKYLWTKSQSNPATKVLYGFTDWGWNLSTNDEYYLPNCHFTGRFLYFLVNMLNGFSKGIESSPNKWKLPNKIHLEGPFLYFFSEKVVWFQQNSLQSDPTWGNLPKKLPPEGADFSRGSAISHLLLKISQHVVPFGADVGTF